MNLHMGAPLDERYGMRWSAQYFRERGKYDGNDLAIKFGGSADMALHLQWSELRQLHEFLTRELEAHQCELDDVHGQVLRQLDSMPHAVVAALP